MHRFQFFPIIAVIVILLALIPIGVYTDFLILSKIAGFLTLIVTLAALKYWFSVLRKNSNRRPIVVLTTNDHYTLNKNYPFIKSWNSEESAILYARIGSVLSEVRMFLANEDVARDLALKFSFVIALKYANHDILPLSGKIIHCEQLEEFIKESFDITRMSFSESITHCNLINFL